MDELLRYYVTDTIHILRASRRRASRRTVRNYDALLFLDTIITITRYHYRQIDRSGIHIHDGPATVAGAGEQNEREKEQRRRVIKHFAMKIVRFSWPIVARGSH